MIQKLNNYHAYKPGSDIWFLPEKKLSLWAKNLNWYVNFLYSKAQKNTKRAVPDVLKNIIKEEDMNLSTDLTNNNQVLLLSSDAYLPNRALAFIRNVSDVEEWFDKILSTSEQLKTHSVRVFLPKGLAFNDVKKYSQKFPENMEVTIVEDGTLV